MAHTASNLLQRVYTKLGMLNVEYASGGSATTAVCSNLVGDKVKDDTWKSGVLFVVRTTDALAPQGKFSRISGYAASSGTFTIDTVTELIGAGDIIAYADNTYPYRLVVEMVNHALRMINIGLVYSSITTAASQTEYTLPVTVKNTEPSLVELQTNADSDDNKWITIYGWRYVPATAGTAATLILPYQPDAGYTIRVWYNGDHPTVDTYEDVISETIDEEMIASMVASAALEWYNSANSGADKFLIERENKVNSDVDQRRAMNPPYMNKKRPKLIYNR